MPADIDFVQALVSRGQESLTAEIKQWLDPDRAEDQAKIVKACLAMRNRNGGFLIIGLNDSGELASDCPGDMRTSFHVDTIQGLVSQYASERFEVSIHFVEKAGVEIPVVEVESGVRTPVVMKRSLTVSGRTLLKANSVFVRSLNANNTPSSTEATPLDWKELMEICFDNREADIGRFVRRHLSSLIKNQGDLPTIFAEVFRPSIQPTASADVAMEFLNEGRQRFGELAQGQELPPHGSFEVSVVIEPQVEGRSANRTLLGLLAAANPQYTGWPAWLDSSGFSNEGSRPHVYENAWEAFILDLQHKITFWRIDPRGRFYQRNSLDDDVPWNQRSPQAPFTELDPILTTYRMGESILVALSFARALGCDTNTARLFFQFRWSRLSGRELTAWANPGVYISRGRKAFQDDVETAVVIPLETPDSAVAAFVHEAISPLLLTFGGFEVGLSVVEETIDRLLTRRI